MTPPKEKRKDDSNSPTQNKTAPSGYYRYTGIAAKMIFVIVAGAFGGLKLDEVLELETPIFTLILTLLSVGLAMYVVIRDLGKSS